MYALLVVLGILVGLVITLFIGIHIYAYSWILIDGIRLRKRMKMEGRVLSMTEVQEFVRAGKGMVFIESPTLGWNVNRIWWAPVSEISQPKEDLRNSEICNPEDRINYEKLIHAEKGIGKIVSIFVFSQNTPKFLKRHFGFHECPGVFSGGVKFVEEIEKRKRSKS